MEIQGKDKLYSKDKSPWICPMYYKMNAPDLRDKIRLESTVKVRK